MNNTPMYMRTERTYSTASEAFKDADYATPIWRCETEWDRSKDILGGMFVVGAIVGAIALIAYVPIEGIISMVRTYA
jgi:hypothetical protein